MDHTLKTESRSHQSILVSYGVKKPQHSATVRNLSANGVVVSAEQLFRTGTELCLQLEWASAEKVMLVSRGRVRWCEYIPSTRPFSGTFEMGVEFLDPDPADCRTIDLLVRELRGRRSEQRFSKSFRVAVDSVDDSRHRYSANLSRSGMFLQTDDHDVIGAVHNYSILNVDIMQVLSVRGRVVNVIGTDTKPGKDGKPGTGIQFVEFGPEDWEKHRTYIERMEQFYNLEYDAFLPDSAQAENL